MIKMQKFKYIGLWYDDCPSLKNDYQNSSGNILE
jgi:hypothetical protein